MTRTAPPPLLTRVTADDLRAALEATGYTLIQSFCHDASRKEGDPFAVLALARGATLPRMAQVVEAARKFLGIHDDYARAFTRSYDRRPYDQTPCPGIVGLMDLERSTWGYADGAAIRDEFIEFHPIPNYSPIDK